MTFARLLIGAIAVAVGSRWFGWWFPAVWGVAAGLLWPHDRPGRTAAVAAALGWAAWLVVPIVGGAPMGLLATKLGALFQLPGWALIALTVVYPALLAGCAAVLTARLRGTRRARGAAPVRQTSSS